MTRARRELLESAVRWLSLPLTILCLFFVGKHIVSMADGIREMIFSWRLAAVAGASLAGLTFAQICVGGILWQSIQYLGRDIKPQPAIYATLRSQIAKYLPGNIFHLGGCLALLRSEGIPLEEASIGMVVQYAALVSVALVAGVPYWLKFPQAAWLSLAGLVILPFLVDVLFRLARRLPPFVRRAGKSKVVPGKTRANLAYAFGLAGIFVLISGLSLYFLLAALPGSGAPPILPVLASFSLAWVAGMAVPGSPGGIGVREAVFILLLAGSAQSGNLAIAATLHRLLWTMTDTLIFFIAPLVKGKQT